MAEEKEKGSGRKNERKPGRKKRPEIKKERMERQKSKGLRCRPGAGSQHGNVSGGGAYA